MAGTAVRTLFKDGKTKLTYNTTTDVFQLQRADGSIRTIDATAAEKAKLALLTLGLTGAKIQLANVTIADDAAATITPIAAVGLAFIFGTDATNAANFLVAAFRAGATPYCTKIVATATLADVGTTDLTGTVGVDTHFTLAAIAAGTLKLENRLGASRNFSYLIIGE